MGKDMRIGVEPINKKIFGLEALSRVFEPESLVQGPLRHCGERGKGFCCASAKTEGQTSSDHCGGCTGVFCQAQGALCKGKE